MKGMSKKSSKKGGMGMMDMMAKPKKKMGGGMMGKGYAMGGSVTSRGNGEARSKKTKIC